MSLFTVEQMRAIVHHAKMLQDLVAQLNASLSRASKLTLWLPAEMVGVKEPLETELAAGRRLLETIASLLLGEVCGTPRAHPLPAVLLLNQELEERLNHRIEAIGKLRAELSRRDDLLAEPRGGDS